MLSNYLLVLLCLYLTVHDLRYRKVPNWITLPLILIVTAIAQILVRILAKKRDVVGIKLPGAWRALAYLIFLVLHNAGWLNYVKS